MKKIIFLLVAFLPLAVSAQTKTPAIRPYPADEAKNMKKEADEYMKLLNFNLALPIYQRLHATDPNDAEINFRLADCYLSTNINKAAAVPYLEFAANAKLSALLARSKSHNLTGRMQLAS